MPQLLFYLAVFLLASTAVAVASDRDACAERQGEKSIAACTREITSGRLDVADQATTYALRGMTYRDKGEYDRAIADFSKAIELSQKSASGDVVASAYVVRASAYFLKGDLEKASADYRAALALNPNNEQAAAGIRRTQAAAAENSQKKEEQAPAADSAGKKEESEIRPPVRKKTATAASHSVRSIAGRWRWKASCTNGPGGGIFYLRETSPSEFAGEFGNSNYWDRGTIASGKLQGNRVTFVSHYATNRTWTATLSGSQMRGSFTGSGDCKFSAAKN